MEIIDIKQSELQEANSSMSIAEIEKPWIAKANIDLQVAHTAQRIRDWLQLISWLDSTTNMFHNPKVIEKSIYLQEKYWFQPLWNTTDFSYLTRVISIDDFARDPNLYFHKLTKWFWSFPLDLDLGTIAKNYLSKCHFGFNNWIMQFQHSPIMVDSVSNESENILSSALNKALIDSWCATFFTEGYIYIDILTFIKNYDKLISFVENEIGNKKAKNNSLEYFKTMKIFSLAIFRTITNITIKSPKWFFESEKVSFTDLRSAIENKSFTQETDNPFKPATLKEELLYLDIENMLLNTANWVWKDSIDYLIKLQNPEQFIILVEKLIVKLLQDSKVKKSWVWKNKKTIDEYDTEELIAFATFLSKYLIEEYGKVEDMVEEVLHGFSPKVLKWKCTDYTGLSLHIINNYFKLKYPEKFKNIIVGYDNQNIWDSYKHCYIKVYGYNKGWLIEVTFIDPTKLSNCSIEKLEITEDVYEAMDASNLPIQIDRTAEDIIIAKLRDDNQEQEKTWEISSEVTKLLKNKNIENTIKPTILWRLWMLFSKITGRDKK